MRVAGCCDVGGTKVLLGLVDQAGKILERERFLFQAPREPREFVQDVAERMRRMVQRAGLTWDEVSGVGCSLAAMLDGECETVLFAENLGPWRGFPIRRTFEEIANKCTVVEMDARAAALGEVWKGTGANADSFVCVSIGTGIGAGVIMNGEIYRGLGTAGEIGHTTVEPNGPLCNCGNYGCLEALAAGPAIARRAAEALQQGRKSALIEMGPENKLTAASVVRAARDGDAVAQEIIRQTADYLGTSLANVLTLLDPVKIALCGGVMQGAGDLLLEPIRDAAMRRCGVWIHTPRERIVIGTLGDDAALLGTARLVWKHKSYEHA